MTFWSSLPGGALLCTFAVQPSLDSQGGNVVEVVTFKLKTGFFAAEFATRDKALEREHVARRSGVASRKSAYGPDDEAPGGPGDANRDQLRRPVRP